MTHSLGSGSTAPAAEPAPRWIQHLQTALASTECTIYTGITVYMVILKPSALEAAPANGISVNRKL